MQVGVGYSDNPDSTVAGTEAAKNALGQTGRREPCDLALLFCTARHNQRALRAAVAAVIGDSARIFGGGSVGIITNETYGYAGDQVGVACIWLDDVSCEVRWDNGLLRGEEAAGERLGRSLAELGVKADTPLMLFYDAVDRSHGDVRLLMATWLLAGLEKGLGFLPEPLTGAGLQGDHVSSPTEQFIGEGLGEHCAMALAFSDNIRIDSAIMHGCRPASQYYTVTKADGPVILEINGEQAIGFMDKLLGPALTPEDYPFFLLFGINHGARWGEYDENNYASRLCLGIDKERGGIVMFEPDMVEGTEFQLMFRSLDLDYMQPKIEELFDRLEGREPVFAVYIDCAGRCAGYGGVDLEDAYVLQQVVGGRVPLLGLYTGVEIAPMGGRPRGLDWTGVFCLFSQERKETLAEKPAWEETVSPPLWETAAPASEEEIPLEAALRLSEQNAAKVLALDSQSIAIRHELEQKRRGFSLLAELAVSLRQSASYESLFNPVAQRINAALNMQKTAVLVPGSGGRYQPSVLQGYTVEEKARLAGRHLELPAEMLDPERTALVNGADDPRRLADIREALSLPYFVSAPVILKKEIAAVMITGRMVEQPPFLSRLGRNDVENVQAITALLASVLVHKRLEATEERVHVMLNAMPLCCVFWDEQGNQTDCNEEALRLFGLGSKVEFLGRFYKLAPEFQPDGRPSEETARSLVLSAFITGEARYEWEYMTVDGERIPSEVTLVRVPRGEDYTVVGYIRDLRGQKAAMEEMRRARDLAEENVRAKSEFLAAVSHEVRTPLNAILAMTRAVSKVGLDDDAKPLVEQGVRSARLLTAAIDSILDFSRLEYGRVELEAKPFAVRDITDSIVGMLGKEAAEKSLTLGVELAPDLPETLIGDAGRLEQAVFNLTINAIKFTDAGEVAIRVYREASEQPDKARIVFAVRDTGIGLDPQEQARIFEPLTAVDSSYSRKQSGLGMGLSVSRRLARLMGGDVVCESAPGKGSVFSLAALLELPRQDAAPAPEPTPEDNLRELAGMRVLVAEDNPINQIIVEEILRAVDIRVTIAANGVEALEALEKEPFDLVLMDIQMPEMDGLTCAAKIRENPRYNDMPILAMTANSAREHRAESLKSGMNDHMTKPIDVQEVYAALKRWDKRSSLPH